MVDKVVKVCYYVNIMKYIIKTLQDKYYTYQPGEFLPVYSGGVLINKKEFHKYRLGWIMRHRHAALYQFTHYSS